MFDDGHGHELLAVVPAMHHERVGEPLNNGTLGLPETLHSIPTSCVWQVNGALVFDCDVILQGEIVIYHSWSHYSGVVTTICPVLPSAVVILDILILHTMHER